MISNLSISNPELLISFDVCQLKVTLFFSIEDEKLDNSTGRIPPKPELSIECVAGVVISVETVPTYANILVRNVVIGIFLHANEKY